MARSKYPFAEMKKGQSFLIPESESEDESMRRPQRRVLSAANQAGYKVSTLRVQGGLRVWMEGKIPNRKKGTRKNG